LGRVAEHRLPEADARLHQQVVAVAQEHRVLLHVHDDHEVAWRRAAFAGFALARDALHVAVLDARRDLDRDRRVLGHEAPALALGTRRLDHLAGAAAARAGLAELEEPLVAHHLAAARAGAAALAAGARLLASTAAVTARLRPLDLERLLAAARDLLEGQRQVHLEARAAPAARAAEQRLEEAA